MTTNDDNANNSTDDEENTSSFDIASIIPEEGDPRRPPAWFTRALLYTGLAVAAFLLAMHAWKQVNWIITDIVISLFIALAMEPVINRLTRHMKRTIASMLTWAGVLTVSSVLIFLFGSMFIEQMTGLIKSIPDTYNATREFMTSRTDVSIPAFNELSNNIMHSIQSDWVTSLADKAWASAAGIGNMLLSLMIIIIVTYYIAAYSNDIRKSVCRFIRPSGQRRFLKAWEIIQSQVSSFLYSRIILAVINAICLAIFMVILKIPYWLPLSLFCGIVSQFIPTIGTYIGGALPVLSAFGSNGFKCALIILVYIIIYQQIENLILSPVISQRTMDLNPAIALLAVFFFGSIFGALGAFMALPVAASIQTVFALYAEHHDVIESELIENTQELQVMEDKNSGQDDHEEAGEEFSSPADAYNANK